MTVKAIKKMTTQHQLHYKPMVKILEVLRGTKSITKRRMLFRHFPDDVIDNIIELVVNLAELNIDMDKIGKNFNNTRNQSMLFLMPSNTKRSDESLYKGKLVDFCQV